MDFGNFEFPVFNDFFFKKTQILHCTLCYVETKNPNYLEKE